MALTEEDAVRSNGPPAIPDLLAPILKSDAASQWPPQIGLPTPAGRQRRRES